MYRNEAGDDYTDVTSVLHLAHHAEDAEMLDLNGDGLLDAAQIDLGVLNVYIQRPDGSFHRAFVDHDLTSGVWVTGGDVNGDNRPDLYLVQKHTGAINAPDVMLINNGTGTGFTPMTVPETTVGDGDSAYPIDYDKNGLSDFLVLNGQHHRGPVQLLAFFP